MPVMNEQERRDFNEAVRRFRDIVQWLRSLDCDVDKHAFVKECDAIALCAFNSLNARVPVSVNGQGFLTLDMVACILHQFVPGDVISEGVTNGLPGAAHLMAEMRK